MNLYHGDCLDVLPSLPAQSVDAVICDIPSGRTACAWDVVIPFDAMWANLKRLVKPRGAIVLLGATQPFTSMLVMSNPKMFRYEWIWEKTRATTFVHANIMPLRAHESVLVFGEQTPRYNPQIVAGEPYTISSKAGRVMGGDRLTGERQRSFEGKTNDGRYPRSVQIFSNPSVGTVHPTQKPAALMEYLIRTYTNEGDTVLDFAAGSGTTGVAAIKTGRKFILIEKEAAYFEIARRRIEEAQAAMVQMELVA